ncbi:hypothetical protein PGT21_026356 [Puccinia graminis f. sp. tritici]|uniref:Uncharacterized protein n=1 Tax=Puccinia graminis f. sp. tritici TaxID=56615 RepID=A0A5B0P2B2_PUCGR|nr:hypothetical protein PGT21_026356 [Puccinia graminis f. sp. tritici]
MPTFVRAKLLKHTHTHTIRIRSIVTMQLSRPHLQSASKGVAPVSTARTPLTRLSQAVGSHGPCHQAASVYGKCVATNYQQVEKDSCLMEFVGKKW